MKFTSPKLYIRPNLHMPDSDSKGDLYEYLLSKVSTSGTNGQFRTPRHIIKMMVQLMKPSPKEKTLLIPAVTHIDRTSRIQLVTKETSPRYYKLISEFKRQTGIPILLNTSFNIQEPIACTPEDAIRTFKRSHIDCLVMGNFLVKKTT